MDKLFFYSSKVVWSILSPDSLFVILLVSSLLLIHLNRKRLGMNLLRLLTFGCVFLSIFSVGEWMLYPLETRFAHNPTLPAELDGIIVLGGSIMTGHSSEWQQLETNRYHERLSSFLELAGRYPQAKLVFTGGNSSLHSDQPSEAELVENYFLNAGIDPERLFMEDRARNTAQNASLSKQLLKPQSGEQWLLITTAYHMPRSIGVFCQQRWPVIPYPVDHQTRPSKLYSPGFSLLGNANTLVMAAHEWTGLLAYYLTAKTASLLPSRCDQSN